tara:strand:+ start:1877 stop:2017 length:141 start_codon:yes stop_codon:yes gene_type:complete
MDLTLLLLSFLRNLISDGKHYLSIFAAGQCINLPYQIIIDPAAGAA